MESNSSDSEEHASHEPGDGARRAGEEPALLLTPPAWMKSVIRVSAANAVGIAVVLSIGMWPGGMRYGFWDAYGRFLVIYGPQPELYMCYPTLWTLLAAVALSVGAYQCIMLRHADDEQTRDEKVLYVAAAHTLALLLLCCNSIFIHRRWLSVVCAMGIHGDSPIHPSIWAFWSSLPVAVLLLLTLPFLGKYVGRYFSQCGWLLQIAVIGMANTAIAIQFFLLLACS